MALRNIRQYPNAGLKEVAAACDKDLLAVHDDLVDTLKVSTGVGLAAPQIGVSNRALVVKPSVVDMENPDPSGREAEIWFLFDPVITVKEESQKIKWEEACLSIPYVSGIVERDTEISVSYKTLKGEEKSVDLSPPMSMIMQHEIDHLDGKLFIDRVTGLSKYILMKKLKKRLSSEKKAISEIRSSIHREPGQGRSNLSEAKRKKLREKRKKKSSRR